jgi:protoporphyrinogen oxidase
MRSTIELSRNSILPSEARATREETAAAAGERWAVVGGGLLGMTLAHRLAGASRRVTLCEGAEQLGGLASAWTLGEVVWDRHYHVTLLSDEALRALLTELGLESEMKWVETRTGFYTGGRLHSMSNSLEFLRFPPLGLAGKFRLGLNVFYASRVKDWRRLERVTAAEWLTRWSGRATFEKIWRPLLRAKLGENYTKVSAAFIWATIARMYAARRTGLKREMFGYVPGGYARILESFRARLVDEGVAVRTGRAVRSVVCAGAGLRVEFENGEAEQFDRVVFTGPSSVAVRVCPELSDGEKSALEGVEYQGIVCASLLLKKPLADFYVTNITDEGVPFTAVIEMSALVDRREFGGHALVYLPRYVTAGDPAFGLSDEELRESFLAALERMYPHFDRRDVLAFRVSRVRHVFPLPTLGYSERLPPVESSVSGLFVVNSAHILNGTLNVNETVRLANRVARELMTNEEQGALKL